MRKILTIFVLLLSATVAVMAQDNSGPINVGYVVVTPTAGVSTGMIAFATFEWRNGSVGASTMAGVLPPNLSTKSMIFVEGGGIGLAPGVLPKNIGVAMVNPNSTDVNVTLTIRDLAGIQIGSTDMTVPARQQVSKFVAEQFSNTSLPANYTGTLLITSNPPATGGAALPLSITGLRFRGSNLSAIPATALAPATTPMPSFGQGVGGPNSILLPQFAQGLGWSTEIVVANSATTPLTVRVDLFKSDGSPMNASLNGASGSKFENLTVQPNGVVRLVQLGPNGVDDF